MMIKRILFITVLVGILIISGCYKDKISGGSVVEIETAICNSPFMKVGTGCCLDKNSNDVCDSKEGKNIESSSSYPDVEEPKIIRTLDDSQITSNDDKTYCSGINLELSQVVFDSRTGSLKFHLRNLGSVPVALVGWVILDDGGMEKLEKIDLFNPGDSITFDYSDSVTPNKELSLLAFNPIPVIVSGNSVSESSYGACNIKHLRYFVEDYDKSNPISTTSTATSSMITTSADLLDLTMEAVKPNGDTIEKGSSIPGSDPYTSYAIKVTNNEDEDISCGGTKEAKETGVKSTWSKKTIESGETGEFSWRVGSSSETSKVQIINKITCNADEGTRTETISFYINFYELVPPPTALPIGMY